jgi:hypothetical protein
MNSLTPGENTVLGMVSGTEVLLVVQPMIYWKNAAQQARSFFRNVNLLAAHCALSHSHLRLPSPLFRRAHVVQLARCLA